MSFNPNIPMASDDLDVSQGDLLQNFQSLDTVYGGDHYAFSNLTANASKHNQVRTPVYVATPPTGLPPTTLATEANLFGWQYSVPLGVLQYSRGPSNAVPTPVTKLHSPSTPIVLAAGNSTNILDFTGLTLAYGYLSAMDTVLLGNTRTLVYVIWTGAAFSFVNITGGSLLSATSAGNVLRITNLITPNVNNLYWTLSFERVA